MIKKLLLCAGIFVALALAGVWASPRDSEATTWAPSFAPTDFYRLDPTTPSTNSDVHAQYNVVHPSANFSAQLGRAITFGDPDVVQTPIPGVGAYIGQLSAVSFLGLVNEGCNSTVPVTFDFVDAEVVSDDFAMTPNVTVAETGAPDIDATQTSFTYTSAGDPIGPSLQNAAVALNEIEIDAERMLVRTITVGTNTYSDVIRGYHGTTATTHDAPAQIRKVNTIFPAGPTDNLLLNMAQDDGDLDNNGVAEFPNGGAVDMQNVVADGADAIPSFIRDSFDPDGNPATDSAAPLNGGYVQPFARYWATTFVANFLIVTLQFVINSPGQLAANNFQNLGWADAGYGYASSTFLQDPLAAPSNSSISDFCNFTSNTFFLGTSHDNACTTAATPPGVCTGTTTAGDIRLAADGGGPCGPTPGIGPGSHPTMLCTASCPSPGTAPNECGSTRQTNPTEQSVRYFQYGVSQRDVDNDGWFNALDTCSTEPNPGWDATASNGLSGGDGDSDGLPDACDPAPAAFDNDQEAGALDGWQNRLDNCPTVSNGTFSTVPNTFQFDFDVASGVAGVPNHVSDGGPASDSIGPDCDSGGALALSPTVADGHYHASYATLTMCVGAATADCAFNPPGLPPAVGDVSDPDSDRVVNASDTCRTVANTPVRFGNGAGEVPTTPVGNGDALITAQVNTTTITVDSVAGFSANSAILIDSPNETLRYITSINSGTNTIVFTPAVGVAAHGGGDRVSQVAFAQTSRDLSNDGVIGFADIGQLTSEFNAAGGSGSAVGSYAAAGYQARYDLSINAVGAPDQVIGFADIGLLTGNFNAGC